MLAGWGRAQQRSNEVCQCFCHWREIPLPLPSSFHPEDIQSNYSLMSLPFFKLLFLCLSLEWVCKRVSLCASFFQRNTWFSSIPLSSRLNAIPAGFHSQVFWELLFPHWCPGLGNQMCAWDCWMPSQLSYSSWSLPTYSRYGAFSFHDSTPLFSLIVGSTLCI